MRLAGVVCSILFCSLFFAGCSIQLPGMHIVGDSPDPVIGQWIRGDPPQSDLHMIFYENQTFFSRNFFINRPEEIVYGFWTKIKPGRYSTQSATGEITDWMYDRFEDSLYISKFPQMKFYRYKG